MDLSSLWILVLGLISSLLIGKPVISFLKQRKSLQALRKHGPIEHLQTKQGTPTLGSLIFTIPFLLLVIYIFLQFFGGFGLINSSNIVIAYFTGFAIGFVDDWLKINKRSYEGLNSKLKLLFQFISILTIWLTVGRSDLNLVTNSFDWWQACLVLISFIWCFVVIAGSSNAFNLTDGIDGLAVTQSIIILLSLYFLVLKANAYVINIDLYLILGLIGCLLGFLWFNKNPAKVFMGDSGSLALGMIIGALAYKYRLEWYLVLVAIVPVLETLSVIVQVTYYKMTKKPTGTMDEDGREIYKGRRIFKMTPIHHHFEKVGWSEWDIVIRFGAISLVAGLVGVYYFLTAPL